MTAHHDLLTAALIEHLTPALEQLEVAPLSSFTSPQRPKIAVAFSGGADSTALLHAAYPLQNPLKFELIALHIHHGISKNADFWLAHCATKCAEMRVNFCAEHIKLAEMASLEAQARRARYVSLLKLCDQSGAQILLTAHHADDQAETVILNLLRGSGVTGLSGMAPRRIIRQEKKNITLLRPFLHLAAKDLRLWLQQHDITHIEDESNADTRFRRNAVRHQIFPVLEQMMPGAVVNVGRSARHAAEARTLLAEIAAEDLLRLAEDDANSLDLLALLQLSHPRSVNVLRMWLSQAPQTADDLTDQYSPSSAVLGEILRQLRTADSESHVEIRHGEQLVRLYRNRIYRIAASLIDRGPYAGLQTDTLEPEKISLIWHGEASIEAAPWLGRFCFVGNNTYGIAVNRLRAGPLYLQTRQGGERMQLAHNRPSRSLKNLYQEAGIPPWQRARLPLLYLGTELIAAAGLGMNARSLGSDADGSLVDIRWQADEEVS